MILFTIFAQNSAVEKDRCGRLDRARGELPNVWRKHPRPPEQISRANRFYYYRFAEISAGFKRDLAALDQVKSIRELAFAQDRLSLLEMSCHRAVRQQGELRAIHAGKKRMKRHARGQWFGFYLSIRLCLCIHDPLQSYLNKFVLFLADNENGTRRRADHAFRCTADAKVPRARVAVCGDDD